jgi:hypothetical protein
LKAKKIIGKLLKYSKKPQHEKMLLTFWVNTRDLLVCCRNRVCAYTKMVQLQWLALRRDHGHVRRKTKLSRSAQFISNQRIYMMNYIKSRPFQSSFSTLTSMSLCNFVHILNFPLRWIFVSSCYLFYTTCFGLTGHHQVYMIVYENCCSPVMLLYFACKMLIKYCKLCLYIIMPWLFLLCTCVVLLQCVIMHYIGVLFKRWICYILLFYLCNCNDTYVF